MINGKAWVEFKDKHIKYVKEFKDGNLVTDNIHDSLVVLYKTDGKTQDFKFTHTKVGDIEQERTDGGVTQKPVYSVNNKSYSTNKQTNGFIVPDKGEIFVVSLENKQ